MMRGVVCVQYGCERFPAGSVRGERRMGRGYELIQSVLQKVLGVARSPQPICLEADAMCGEVGAGPSSRGRRGDLTGPILTVLQLALVSEKTDFFNLYLNSQQKKKTPG